MTFSELIRTTRSKIYPTPYEFYRKNKLSCSYYHYTKIESGNVPSIPLAVEILNSLNIPIKRGIYALVRTELPDKETRALFADPEQSEFKSFGDTMSLDKSLIVNKAQADLLRIDPLYLEIALFLSCHLEKKFSSNELSKSFGVEKKQMSDLLENLVKVELVYFEQNKYWTKNWIYIPEDPSFIDLKELNLKRALYQHNKQKTVAKWHKTLTLNVNEDLKKTIEEMLDNVSKNIIALSDTSKAAKTLTVGLFSSWRTFGND